MTASSAKTNLQAKLAALGPGILLATAAIGGSHIVASTQAGALFGWQLAWLILLVNVLKYPFFRFGVEYTLNHGESLLQGYQRKGRWYLRGFVLLSLIAAVVNTAGVLLLTASLLKYSAARSLRFLSVNTRWALSTEASFSSARAASRTAKVASPGSSPTE
jgi:Mn2+/Fe2+ NRAMP family transporter